MGSILKFFHLLPPATYLAGSSSDGLRIISKLQWVNDNSAPLPVSLSFDDRGYIISHEDVYSTSGILGSVYLYPVFWMLAYMHLVVTIFSFIFGGFYKVFKRLSPIRIRSRRMDEVSSGSFDVIFKQPFGWLLADVFLARADQFGKLSPEKKLRKD